MLREKISRETESGVISHVKPVGIVSITFVKKLKSRRMMRRKEHGIFPSLLISVCVTLPY